VTREREPFVGFLLGGGHKLRTRRSCRRRGPKKVVRRTLGLEKGTEADDRVGQEPAPSASLSPGEKE